MYHGMSLFIKCMCAVASGANCSNPGRNGLRYRERMGGSEGRGGVVGEIDEE